MKLDAPGLRGRLALALTALSASMALLLALAFWAGEGWLERNSMRELTRHETRTSAITLAEQADLAYAEDLTRRRAYWLATLLLGGTAAVAGMAWWLSGRIARRSLLPLGELVEQIRGIDLEQRQHRLTLASPDPELQVIVSALNAHMAELDALVERERAFAAAASHELRTPLTVIGGAAAVLAELPQVPVAVLARIERAVTHARQDLEALLALSRGREPAPASLARLDLLLPDIVAVHRDAIADTGTRLHWDISGPVERRLAVGPLAIIFRNLLRNAVRAAKGGEIRIKVTADGIEVADNGPGLPAELLRGAALTAPAARRDGGSGMGLYIAQVLAQREGWTLAFKAAPGGGACVELRFA